MGECSWALGSANECGTMPLLAGGQMARALQPRSISMQDEETGVMTDADETIDRIDYGQGTYSTPYILMSPC